jgi:hypothetical protein
MSAGMRPASAPTTVEATSPITTASQGKAGVS